jgi:hypothetical protein
MVSSIAFWPVARQHIMAGAYSAVKLLFMAQKWGGGEMEFHCPLQGLVSSDLKTLH